MEQSKHKRDKHETTVSESNEEIKAQQWNNNQKRQAEQRKKHQGNQANNKT